MKTQSLFKHNLNHLLIFFIKLLIIIIKIFSYILFNDLKKIIKFIKLISILLILFLIYSINIQFEIILELKIDNLLLF